ncbi:Alpha-dioxygenase 1 [Zea mays]|uniref:Alpha-dioxygenase 1 n=1 Tax=Zea mays TaxID=4577 RepID=A0A1D6FU48_MAIZE|nr:Alpha-dioxygenase 1 [Zea mays]
MANLNITNILEKMIGKDKDYRYMATSDLLSELNKESFKADQDLDPKLTIIVQQLEDASGNVFGLAVKCWVGVSILQALFVKERNAVCDAIKEEHPNLSDEELYRYARLVTSAVIAKVHTVDWAVELLKTKTMRAGMHANCIDIGELVGLKGEEQLSKIGFEKKILSMGYQACGTLELWNYPSFFRDLIPQNLDRTNRSDRIDLAALEGMKFGPNLYHISRGS